MHTTMPARNATILPALLLVALCVGGAKPAELAQRAVPGARALPGRQDDGRVRLPNGWWISPAGRQVDVGDFPLGLAVSADERWAVVTHSGWKGHGLDVVDLERGQRVQTLPLDGTWLGIAFFDQGRMLAAAGGHTNRLYLYAFDAGRARLVDSLAIGPPWSAGGQYPQGRDVDYGAGALWPTGLAADDARGRLYAVTRLDSSLYVMDVAGRRIVKRVPLGAVPYTCLLSHTGDVLYVSLWGGSGVAVVDATTLAITRVVAVGEHPSDLAESPDGRRLFVANANLNTVSVVDLATGRVSETLSSARDPREPAGMTPNGVALDASGRTLYVANAGAACVAVFDVCVEGRARALGMIPAGWYPTCVRTLEGRQALVIANGKGAGSAPGLPSDADTLAWCRYVIYGPAIRGTLSLVPKPDAAQLARHTRRVIENTPAFRARTKAPVARLPIEHVFYVIKENRSYDQVFGDMPRGNGDPSLCLFGRAVTPNHHALADQWALLDNVYCDADGSADGHNWETAAYTNDYVEKSQGTAKIYDFEGGNPQSYPSGGFLWDACKRAHVSYRSYGEFVFNGDAPGDTMRAGVPGLEGHVAPHYRGYDTSYSDLDRERAWREEFDRYDRDGGLPRLSIIRLPNDHTEGTCTNRPTPRAHMAENDLALGRMVERISHSRYWKRSLILVIEDDAGNGPDHVDCHRTVALAIGPYVRRRAVDSGFYPSVSLLRTIEEVLGLPPLSQFDARAPSMASVFTSRPDFTPYDHLPAGVDVDEKNVAGVYGQAESDAMDFTVADAVPTDRMNEILWVSVHGLDAPMPALVRGAFASRLRQDRDDDDARARREAPDRR